METVFRSKFALIAGSIFLTSCAVAPMSSDAYRGLVGRDAAKVSSAPLCCQDWHEVNFDHELASSGIDIVLETVQVRDFGNYRAPVAGLRMPAGVERQRIEVFSFSDSRYEMLRFDDRLFIRPNVLFLDSEYRPIQEVKDPPMCWGSRDGGAGIWQRFEIPARASYVILSSSVRVAMQGVDTRQRGAFSPGRQLIADALGKTYNSTVAIGYTGLLSVRAVALDALPLGWCVDPASTD